MVKKAKPAFHLKLQKSHLSRRPSVREDNNEEALVTDARTPISPSSKNTMSCNASPVSSTDCLIFLFPAMKKRISLKLRLRRTAVGSSSAIPKSTPAPIATETVPAPESRLWGLHLAQRQVLTSLRNRNHWQGLVVFVTYPEAPMDNNRVEQAIRNPVIGRKNYYGSGSIRSAKLAAMKFSLFQTIEPWRSMVEYIHLILVRWLSSFLFFERCNYAK